MFVYNFQIKIYTFAKTVLIQCEIPTTTIFTFKRPFFKKYGKFYLQVKTLKSQTF